VSSRVLRQGSHAPEGRSAYGATPAVDDAPSSWMPSVAADAEAPRTISEREYRQFQALVEREAGIHLGPGKKALLVSRLRRRLVELRLVSFSDYYDLVTAADSGECIRMLDAISTNETSFFREARQFEFLQQTVLPRWLADEKAGCRPRQIRAWCAACATGEEPFSLGMLLLDRFPPGSGWALTILASDISTRALARAALGSFPIEDAKEIPRAYLQRFMLRGTRSQKGKMRVAPALQDLVTFRRINLNASAYPVQGPFDLILCRNVLMYFEPAVRIRIATALLDLLAPEGYLFLGHAESLGGFSERARHVGPAIYAHEARAQGSSRRTS
jgi:chemotaxis protein methyltransferase CheR